MRKLTYLAVFTILACVTISLSDAGVAYADSVTDLLAQSDTRSTPRVNARGIRGLIYLVIAVIGGIGWLFKKMFGGDDD